jgi:hypothetical protein
MAFKTLDNPPAGNRWLQHVRDVVNNIMRGKINALVDITLTANSGTTSLASPLLSGSSGVYWTPLTANAAAEVGAGTIYISAQGNQTATLTHANNAQTDRTFRILIIG